MFRTDPATAKARDRPKSDQASHEARRAPTGPSCTAGRTRGKAAMASQAGSGHPPFRQRPTVTRNGLGNPAECAAASALPTPELAARRPGNRGAGTPVRPAAANRGPRHHRRTRAACPPSARHQPRRRSRHHVAADGSRRLPPADHRPCLDGRPIPALVRPKRPAAPAGRPTNVLKPEQDSPADRPDLHGGPVMPSRSCPACRTADIRAADVGVTARAGYVR